MKTTPIISKNALVGGLGALMLFGISGCATDQGSFGDIGRIIGLPGFTNREVAQNEYVYYPDHDLYYNRNSRQFLSVENNRWVKRNQPRNVSSDRVFSSRYVTIDGYDSPAQHRDSYYQEARYRSSRPAPVTNRRWNREDGDTYYKNY